MPAGISEIVASKTDQPSSISTTLVGKSLIKFVVTVFIEPTPKITSKKSPSLPLLIGKKKKFETQFISEEATRDSYTAEWISGNYKIRITAGRNVATADAGDILNIYLAAYPSTLK